MKILGLVCMRKGSKRLENKNIKVINNKPLYRYALDALELSSYMQDIYLVTDYTHIKYKNILLRPPEQSTDDKPLQDTILWAYEQIGKRYDAVCHVMATNPWIDNVNVNESVYMLERFKFDIIRSYDIFGRENGLILFKTNLITSSEVMFPNKNKVFDVYTGSLECEGKEIHTLKDFNLTKREMKR